MPLQYIEGRKGKALLLGISKRGNSYLRTQFVHGARSVLNRAKGKSDRLSRWAVQLEQRRGRKVAIVALAAAEEVGAAIDAAGFDDVILYSDSGGVHASLRFAAQYPKRVRKLVIVGGYVKGRARRGNEQDFLRGMVEEDWSYETSRCKLETMVLLWCFGRTPSTFIPCREIIATDKS